MVIRNQHTYNRRLVYEADLLREAWHNMETEKIRIYANFLISVFVVSAALYQGNNLDIAIGAATIIQGVSFKEIVRHYVEAKNNNQTTFEKP